ncbi:porin, partial [Accumulibacter sp.]|uniref:porin n=1 Tax=Accumulibacter sp. TaxID=2053492 RepID=UPI0028C4EAB3
LGNGLKASFTLEYALDLDHNSGIGNSGGLNARQQFVALSSSQLGAVALGHQYAPGHDGSSKNSPFGGSSHLSPQAILSAAAGNTITPASGSHWSHALTYTSPNFSGFTGKAIYGFGESSLGGYNNASTIDNGKFGLGGNYANGPLNVDVVYQTRQSVNLAFPNPAGMGKDIHEGYIGASYDFKVVEIAGSYQAQNDPNVTNQDNSTWTLAAVVPVMAASKIHFGYGQTGWDQGHNAATTLLNGKSEVYMLGWSTSMNKRASLYAGYLYVDNDQDSLGVSPSGVGAPGESNQTVLAGIRHTF